jgi:hypothetical protein
MSQADLVEVVRFAFRAPHGAVDQHIRAGNQCTILALEAAGHAQYAQGLLEHGPREGEPPTARYAEGTLLFFSNDPVPRQGSMGPFTPLERILITLRPSDDGATLELRPGGNAPLMTVPLVQWCAGAMMGTGQWGGLAATYLVDVALPKAID